MLLNYLGEARTTTELSDNLMAAVINRIVISELEVQVEFTIDEFQLGYTTLTHKLFEELKLQLR